MTRARTNRRAAGVLVACLSGLAGCSTTHPAAPAATPSARDHALERARVVEITATVDAVDPQARRITFRVPKGEPVTLAVDESVRTLGRVRRGDRVKVRYRQSVAVQIRKPGAPGTARAPSGQAPAGAGTRSLTVTTKLSAVDRKHETVTFTGADGKPTTVGVPDPAELDTIAAGDLVEITYVEAVVLTVTKVRRK